MDLLHQAREALSRGERQRLHAAITAIDSGAGRRADGALSVLTERALDELWSGADRFSPQWRAESITRSGTQMFSGEVRQAMQRGYATLRQELGALEPSTHRARLLAEAGKSYLQKEAEDELLMATLHVDGCFHVGGVLSPVRVVEEHRRMRQVRFPTQDMVLQQARQVEDLPDAIIEDPRTLLLSLAAGRLLSRRYVVEEVSRRERSRLEGEVRCYVLDGSGSMIGARARMRDSILVAELATLIERFNDAHRTLNPTLYYRYFTKKLHPTVRVDSAAKALAAIEEALSRLHAGGTDIQAALLGSFEQIREAQRQDENLARAQIVLVTDGEADIDAEAVREAREAVHELPVGVSIIALGQQNEALRELAARQRARGEPCFYHFVSDDELQGIVEGRSAGLPIHLPAQASAGELSQTLHELVEEMATLERQRDTEQLMQTEHLSAAHQEMTKLGLGEAPLDARWAATKLRQRDQKALNARFDRWFPPELEEHQAPVELTPSPQDTEALALVTSVLVAVAEVVEILDASRFARQVDAIEILHRLLVDAAITPWHYAELLRRYPRSLKPSVELVRGITLGR